MQQSTNKLLSNMKLEERIELTKALNIAELTRQILTRKDISIIEFVKHGISTDTMVKFLNGTHRFDLATITKVEVALNSIIGANACIKLLKVAMQL